MMLLHNANDAPDILPLLAGGLGCLRKLRSPRQRREDSGWLQSNFEYADFRGLTIFLAFVLVYPALLSPRTESIEYDYLRQ